MTLEPIRWKVPRVIDAHTHYGGEEPIAHYMEEQALAGHDRGVLLTCNSIPREGAGAYAYEHAPVFRTPPNANRFYLFGGLSHDAQQVARGDGGYLAPQVAALAADGYDGIKMMEGSPYFRRELPHPLDHEYFRPFWDAAEGRGIPITMHLSNPIDYWQRADMAATHRDGQSQEAYFREAEAVLAAHPQLRICFAHFMFMGPQLPRLDALFRRYSEMRVDLAMGNEYMYYLSDDVPAARDFFVRWQDRILYGTDINGRNSLRLARAKAETIRLFLETDEPFVMQTSLAMDKPPEVGSNGRVELHGLNLPVPVLARIFCGNAEAWLGD